MSRDIENDPGDRAEWIGLAGNFWNRWIITCTLTWLGARRWRGNYFHNGSTERRREQFVGIYCVPLDAGVDILSTTPASRQRLHLSAEGDKVICACQRPDFVQNPWQDKWPTEPGLHLFLRGPDKF